MAVYPTGLGGNAVVPCSHCNPSEGGPEAGICHRAMGRNSIDNLPCNPCVAAKHGSLGVLGSLVRRAALDLGGHARLVPCSYCDGKGYAKV